MHHVPPSRTVSPNSENVAISRGRNVGKNPRHARLTLLTGERERGEKRGHLSPRPDIHSSSCHGRATQRAPEDSNEKSAGLAAADMRGKLLGPLQAPRHRRGDSAPWFACHSISPGEAYGMTRSAPLTWLFIQFAQTWEWARCPGRPLSAAPLPLSLKFHLELRWLLPQVSLSPGIITVCGRRRGKGGALLSFSGLQPHMIKSLET